MNIKPYNKRLLLLKEDLKQETETPFFFNSSTTQNLGDFYRVLDKAVDCVTMVEPGDLISAEVTTILGKIQDNVYHVCHENSVIAVIKE